MRCFYFCIKFSSNTDLVESYKCVNESFLLTAPSVSSTQSLLFCYQELAESLLQLVLLQVALT